MRKYFNKKRGNFTLSEALEDMKEVFDNKKFIIDKWLKESEDKVEEDWKEMLAEGPMSDKTRQRCIEFNTVTRIWTSRSNFFKWINQALFLDVLKVAIGGDTPEFFNGSFPGKEADYYMKIIQKWEKFMSLLNLFITNKSVKTKNWTLFRVVGDWSSIINAAEQGRYRFIQYSASSEILGKTLETFAKNKETVSVYYITKPDNCAVWGKIEGDGYGKSKFPNEKEHLIAPYAIFTLEKTTTNVDEIDDYEEESKVQVRDVVSDHIEKQRIKPKTFTYAKIVLKEWEVKGNKLLPAIYPFQNQ